jgi:ATP-dependent RNA helicase DeaD
VPDARAFALRSANVEATWAKPPSADDVMARDRERLFSDPSLLAPLSAIEETLVQEVLARHGAEQAAAAFVRKYFADQAAPEELLDTAPPERARKQRDDFKDGVWISLSIGRDQRAEPRWLLPMLCRAGHITKREIGAIRIQATETFVELAPNCVDTFFETLGPDPVLEKTISITRLEGAPALSDNARGDSHGKPHGKPTQKREFSRKPDEKPDGKSREAPGEKPDEKPARKKPWDKTAKKTKGKKRYKSNFSEPGARDSGPDRPGSAPLKRKKPKKTSVKPRG